jgi:hypothetical protein
VPIVSSAIVEDAPQIDGRRAVTEAHTDQVGVVRRCQYMAGAGEDVAATMGGRVAQINAGLVSDEIASNMAAVCSSGSFAAPTFVHSTVAANVAAFRAAYAGMANEQAIMMGDFLASRTDAALQNALGLTAGQVAALRSSKLTPAASAATAIRTTTGA